MVSVMGCSSRKGLGYGGRRTRAWSVGVPSTGGPGGGGFYPVAAGLFPWGNRCTGLEPAAGTGCRPPEALPDRTREQYRL